MVVLQEMNCVPAIAKSLTIRATDLASWVQHSSRRLDRLSSYLVWVSSVGTALERTGAGHGSSVRYRFRSIPSSLRSRSKGPGPEQQDDASV
jgi:hypothetical protein